MQQPRQETTIRAVLFSSFLSPLPPPPLFNRNPSVGHPLSLIERSAAVALCCIGETQQQTANQIGCSRQTVSHWQHTFKTTGNIADASRSGRPRITSELQDTELVAASVLEPFTTPHQLKRKLELEVSSHTIDRRLIEAGLPGRVAVHKHQLNVEHIGNRLSFAEGYKN